MGGGSDVGQGEVSCQSNLGGGWIHCGDRGRGDVVQHGLDVGEPMMLADIGGKEVTVQVGGGEGGGTCLFFQVATQASVNSLQGGDGT